MSTETKRTIRDGQAQDGHLDFHTAPELCLEVNCTPVLSVLPPGGVVGSLNMECYNRTQPRLRECEDRYGQEVVNIQRQWAQNQLDNVAVHKAACRSVDDDAV